MIPTQTGLGLARGDLGKRFRGVSRDITPRFLGERGESSQSQSHQSQREVRQ